MQNDLSVRVMASTDFGPEGNIGKFLTWWASLDRNVMVAFVVYAAIPTGYARLLTKWLDFNAVEAVVDATHRYPEMFYSKEQ